MRLIDFRIEKSHSFYLIIYQYFKSIFSAKDETMRLFSKKLFHVRENYESFKQFIEESSTCMVKNGLKAQSG